jgi:hypothetical protein
LVSNRFPNVAVVLLVFALAASIELMFSQESLGQVINSPATDQHISKTSQISVQGQTIDPNDSYVIYIEYYNGTNWVAMASGGGVSQSNGSFSNTFNPPIPSNQWNVGGARVRLICTGGNAAVAFIID